jgi:hypothetical protein
MERSKSGAKAILVIAMLSICATAARAGESYFYSGTGGRSASFHLIGGQYSLYLYAKRPIKGYYTPESERCIFGGNLQRVWPTHEVMSLGSGVTLSTIVPHKIGPVPITLPTGLYALYIAPLTDCDWHFSLESTSQNTAGVAPVEMLRRDKGRESTSNSKGGLESSSTASVKDLVQVYAQYRTDHDSNVPASGELQIIHYGKIVQTFPLKVGHDVASGASTFFLDIQWEPSDSQYLGKNTVKFIVKIGSAEFTSDGEFTLTQ